MRFKIQREWATPLTIGAFALMATTGILMFFHLDSGLNKTAHEWLGWVMVSGVVLHASVNWLSFKRYFTGSGPARAILIASVVVIAGSFVQLGGGGDGPPPPFLAVRAVLGAPLTAVAPLTGRPAEQLLADLKAGGFALTDSSQSLASVIGQDRAREDAAFRILFK